MVMLSIVGLFSDFFITMKNAGIKQIYWNASVYLFIDFWEAPHMGKWPLYIFSLARR